MRGAIPSRENRIVAVIFIGFDNERGAEITHHVGDVPPDFLDPHSFKNLESYFVSRNKQLRGKLIVTQLSDYQTVGIPISIQHSVPDPDGRQVSIFNIVFITRLSANIAPYEKILKKLITYFMIFEQEHRFLSCGDGKKKIQTIIESVYHGINGKGYCSINVTDELNIIKLSYIDKQHFQDPPKIKDSDVVIVTADLKDCETWDLTLKELYPYLDNQKPVKLLADLSRLDLVLVKKCVQTLIYYNLASVISPIQYSNTYYITSAIHTLMQDEKMQNECRNYVKIVADSEQPSWADIFNLYVTFQSGIKLKRLLMYEKPFLKNINERRLVEFGLLKGILNKLHKYPILKCPKSDIPGEHKDIPPDYLTLDLLDGQHSFDDICVILKYKLNKVEEDLEFSNLVTIFQKLGV